MNQVLKECQGFAQSYIDDVVDFSRSWDEHLYDLRKVFVGCSMQVWLSGCQFGHNKVHYLGHIIPKTQVNSFIDLYYRNFVASIATPLTNLLRKKQPEKITWSEECEEAFQKLKASLLSHPVLKVLEANRSFIVHTDASDSGLGAVLSQTGEDGEEHPISYASRKLRLHTTSMANILRWSLTTDHWPGWRQ